MTAPALAVEAASPAANSTSVGAAASPQAFTATQLPPMSQEALLKWGLGK